MMRATIKIEFVKVNEKPIDEADAMDMAQLDDWKCRISEALNEICDANDIASDETSVTYELED